MAMPPGAPGDVLPAALGEETYGPVFLRTSIAFCVLTCLIVCHRITFVCLQRGWLGTEDITLILATVRITRAVISNDCPLTPASVLPNRSHCDWRRRYVRLHFDSYADS